MWLHVLRDPSHIFIWAFPPIVGVYLYFKFSRTISPPAFRTPRQMLLASAACFLMCLLFLVGAAIDINLLHRAPDVYFGLGFPQPPGRFAAMALASASPRFLFALHAAFSKLSARG